MEQIKASLGEDYNSLTLTDLKEIRQELEQNQRYTEFLKSVIEAEFKDNNGNNNTTYDKYINNINQAEATNMLDIIEDAQELAAIRGKKKLRIEKFKEKKTE